MLNKKLLLIPWGLRVPIWQINLCSRVFRLSEPPRCRERTQTHMLFWTREIKVSSDWFGYVIVISFHVVRCSRNGEVIIVLDGYKMHHYDIAF